MKRLSAIACSLLLAAQSAIAAENKNWDEFGVAMSRDEHADPSGPAGFSPRAASLRLTPLPDDDAAVIDLNGTWRFKANPPRKMLPGITPSDIDTWDRIEVPGDFAMLVKDTARGGYARTVNIPADWRGKRVKIRFDEVASAAELWINGKPIGEHVGHFIPFEFDISNHIEFGADNLVTVLAHKDSLARKMSGYALHVGGGITRGVRIFCVPKVHIASLHAATDFDPDFKDATLELDLAIANEGTDSIAGTRAMVELRDSSGKILHLPSPVLDIPAIKPEKMLRKTFRIKVPKPLHWTAENPHLYQLLVTLKSAERNLEQVLRRIGFREIEINGKQFLINGTPVKLRGSNRHLAHPLRGRSLTPELARLDARLFKQANCNFIRTAHYPPSEEFIAACDELGLYVEEEAPFCFFNPKNQKQLKMDAITRYATYANLKMVERDRSHPSVIIWSIGNESRWGTHFAAAAKAVAEADPTRGRTFMWFDKQAKNLTIEAEHYPGPDGVTRCHGEIPKLFSEYCHLPAYAPQEMFTDPGVEDRWGEVIETTWNNLHKTGGALGGAIWCGVDDRFHKPTAGGREIRGVAPWGILDGWRRPKPAYWHTRKAYSPVRIPVRHIDLPAAGKPLRIPVENRYDFTNLNQLLIAWKLDETTGTTTADLAPRQKGTFEIPATSVKPGDILAITITHPDGRTVDEYSLPIGEPVAQQPGKGRAVTWNLTETAGQFIVRSHDTACTIDRKTGQITDLSGNGTTLLTAGPRLAVVPTFAPAQQREMKKKPIEATQVYGSNWQLESTKATAAEVMEITWKGHCDEASIIGAYKFLADGEIEINYSLVPLPAMLKQGDLVWLAGERLQRAFVKLKDASTAIVAHPNRGGDERETPLENVHPVPRQVGMIFEVPATLDTLRWKRSAQWTSYPDDHIGRPLGTAQALPPDRETTTALGTEPTWPWSLDASALGTRDFRSTKRNIHQASLTNAVGLGIELRSDGSQSSRAHLAGNRIHWLVTARDGGPSESFLDNYFAPHRIRLKLGKAIHDTIRLRPILSTDAE